MPQVIAGVAGPAPRRSAHCLTGEPAIWKSRGALAEHRVADPDPVRYDGPPTPDFFLHLLHIPKGQIGSAFCKDTDKHKS